MDKKYVYDLFSEEWGKYLSGEPKYRAGQLFAALQKGTPFEEVYIPKTLKSKIAEDFYTALPEIVKEQKSKDSTIKFLLKLNDDQLIECVLLEQDYRSTVCISTQVGCKMGCTFCASGANGFVRNLSAGEMLAQILIARSLWAIKSPTPNPTPTPTKTKTKTKAKSPQETRITNVVLMGSGEPFDNFDNVVKFLGLVPIGARHISLSTLGIAPKIKEFADLGLQVNLCISLHAPTDEIRARLMPAARKWPIKDLIDSAKYFFEKTHRREIFEYSLIDGVNCLPGHAASLAKLVKGFPNHINLISLNSTGGNLKPPDRHTSMAFMNILIKAGASCTMRKSRGDDIAAACGQLKLQSAKCNDGKILGG
jgi:23S rRNA (adenine2503-C2)-methyltransferase